MNCIYPPTFRTMAHQDIPDGIKAELNEIDALAQKIGPFLLPYITFTDEMVAYMTFLQNQERARLCKTGLGYYEIIDGETVYIIDQATPDLIAHLQFLINLTDDWYDQFFMLTRIYEMYSQKTWESPNWDGVTWLEPPTPPAVIDYPTNLNN